VRNGDDGSRARCMPRGAPDAGWSSWFGFLGRGTARGASGGRQVSVEEVRSEGHEQFAVRGGQRGGCSSCRSTRATAHHFRPCAWRSTAKMRSWARAQGAVDGPGGQGAWAVPGRGSRDRAPTGFEGATDGGGVIVWDRGSLRAGRTRRLGRRRWEARAMRVFRAAWPEACAAGLALQRTRAPARRSRSGC